MPDPLPSPALPLTLATATDHARQAVADLHSKHDFILQEDQTQTREFGWVFYYNTRAYLKSHNPNDMVPGVGPLIVEKATGKVTFVSTSAPPKIAVEAWEQEWRRQTHRPLNE